MDYSHLIVDAQYIITRNAHKMEHFGNEVTRGSLLKGFIESIVKLTRDVKTNKVILAWDGSPYFRLGMLDDYKQDRTYVTQEDIDAEEDPEEKAKKQRKVDIFKARQEVKYHIISEGHKLGFHSLIKKGYEADDFGMLISKHPLIKNSPKKSIVASADSDWTYFMHSNMDFFSTHNRAKVKHKTHDMIKNQVHDMDPYFFKTIHDSLFSSHNNLRGVSTGVTNNVFTVLDMIAADDYSFTNDKDRFLLQVKTFDAMAFPDYDIVSKMIDRALTTENTFMTSSAFSQYCMDNLISIRYGYYEDFIKRLK